MQDADSPARAYPDRPIILNHAGMLVDRDAADIRPFVLETIAIFGTRRTMFASNFLVDKLYNDFDALFAAFDSITAEFSEDERRFLFCDNARHGYRP